MAQRHKIYQAGVTNGTYGVKANLQPSPNDAQPATRVYDNGETAPSKLNLRPTPGSGLFFGTAATTSRATGLGAWNGGAGSIKRVIDRIDAPFHTDVDPEIQSNP
jgi:hypothetical protein